VNTKWLSLAAFVPACHQTRVILTQPLNHRMPVSRNDLRDLRDWRKCKLAFPSLSLRCLGWVYKNENEYQMAESCGFRTYLIMMQHVQFSTNLYTTALTVLHVMFPATFKREGHPV
jgi:hypothetical protein